MDNDNLYQAAAMVYGEMGSKDQAHWDMAASSYFNSLDTGEWKGLTSQELLNKRYYAVSNKNDPYTWAMTKKFPNDKEEHTFKKILSRVSAMSKGKIEKTSVQFYFTKGEITKLKKNKAFNFDLVEPTGKIGRYFTFRYK
jgi:hypothetical protein